MKNVSEWNTFMKTGRVEDYLRYTGCVSETCSGTISEHSKKEKKDVERTNAESDYRIRNRY